MSPEATFTRLGQADEPMFGPRALLVCGFPVQDQIKLLRGLSGAGSLGDLNVIFATDEDQELVISEILDREHRSGMGQVSPLARATIMSGCTEQEVHGLLNLFKTLRFTPQLMATLTPTSAQWSLEDLLTEMNRERATLAGL
ncbi:MAG: DUF3783 domain-containing protein [Deltaproteobacteria bacterium]|nr:DUF3783 domain-containing protein [Deltaproteobacteria bacterium]